VLEDPSVLAVDKWYFIRVTTEATKVSIALKPFNAAELTPVEDVRVPDSVSTGTELILGSLNGSLPQFTKTIDGVVRGFRMVNSCDHNSLKHFLSNLEHDMSIRGMYWLMETVYQTSPNKLTFEYPEAIESANYLLDSKDLPPVLGDDPDAKYINDITNGGNTSNTNKDFIYDYPTFGTHASVILSGTKSIWKTKQTNNFFNNERMSNSISVLIEFNLFTPTATPGQYIRLATLETHT
jgi:hypothetical protein